MAMRKVKAKMATFNRWSEACIHFALLLNPFRAVEFGTAGSLEDSANLPDPDIIAAEIVEDLHAALAQFAEIANDLKK
jgi:hypothetical protein